MPGLSGGSGTTDADRMGTSGSTVLLASMENALGGVATALAAAGAVVLWTVLATATATPHVSLPTTPTVEQGPVSPPPGPNPAAARLDELAMGLSAPGVQIERREHDVRVVFDDGLFLPDGNRFTPAGGQALDRWAAHLTGRAVRVTVLGHGVVVPGGPTTGGSTVAMSRATTAATVLASASGLPRMRGRH